MAQRAAIDRLFKGDSVDHILDALGREANSGGEAAALAAKTAATLRTKSPLSLKLALAQVRRGAACDFATCMRMEMRIVSRVIEGHDFYEGVRAVIVDKDNKPQWNPPQLAQVSAQDVERHFAPLDGGELALP
jgi:enoyl-CoA hydratase